MESSSNVSTITFQRPQKRLLFDRRYGFVIDEWRDPSVEALVGGRGMFCIVPLAKALFNMGSHMINLVGSSTIKVIERPDLLSPETVQTCLQDNLHKFMAPLKKPKFNVFAKKGNSALLSTSSSSIILAESS